MQKPYDFKGKTALITGAGGGIGQAIAVSLAKRGAHLALADVNKEGLQRTLGMLAASGARRTIHHLDVSDAGAIQQFPDEILSYHPGVDVLVNNAGVALGGDFEQCSQTDFEWLFSINFWGVVRMTRAFLPALKASDDALLVNLSSLFGLIAPPGQTAYASSKFAVRGFSQALARELKTSSVGVVVVHPGGVATSIAKSAKVADSISPEEAASRTERTNRLLKLAPDRAGEIIVHGAERRKARILVGRDAKLAALIERIAPVGHTRLLDRPRRANTAR